MQAWLETFMGSTYYPHALVTLAASGKMQPGKAPASLAGLPSNAVLLEEDLDGVTATYAVYTADNQLHAVCALCSENGYAELQASWPAKVTAKCGTLAVAPQEWRVLLIDEY